MPRDTIKKMGIKQIDGAQVVKDIGVKAENVEQIVASYEVTPASAPHAIGDLIYFNDILYKVIQNIALEDALVVDTNISADTGIPALTQVHINGLPGGGGGGDAGEPDLYKYVLPQKDPNTMESITSEESTASFSHLKGTTFWVNYDIEEITMQMVCVATENINVGDILGSKIDIVAAPPQHYEFGDWTNYLSDKVGELLTAGGDDEEDFSATNLLGKNLIKKKEYYLYNPAKYFHAKGSLLLINNEIYKATTDIHPEDTLDNTNVIPVTNLASTNNLFNFLYPINENRDENVIGDNLLLKWESERLPGEDIGDFIYTWSALYKNSDDYSKPEVGDEILILMGRQ